MQLVNTTVRPEDTLVALGLDVVVDALSSYPMSLSNPLPMNEILLRLMVFPMFDVAA
jgi:hypothetical protein